MDVRSSKWIRPGGQMGSSWFNSRLTMPLLWLLVIGLSVSSQLVFARTEGIDAVLLIDSSGSMKQTDPKRMRVPAAKLFINLLGADDRVGLVSFSDNGYPVIHLTEATSDNQKKIFAGVDRVSALGAYTNLYAALATGLKMLNEESGPDRRRMLVLMSDGKMDVGDWEQDQQLTESIRQQLLPEFNKAHIEVYTIAFTEASDMQLLQDIARDTGALSRMASNDRELDKVFATIFESAKQPDMLPLEDDGGFLVDAAVQEVTLVINKSVPDESIYLAMPDGRKMTAENAGRAVRWFKSDLFDMVTIVGPPPGKWHLSSASATGGDRVYVVTDLGLDAAIGEGDFAVGEQHIVRAWLSQQNDKISKPEILENSVFGVEIEQPDGTMIQAPLVDSGAGGDEQAGDGIFSTVLTLLQPGTNKLRFAVRSETFEREKILYIDVPQAAEPSAVPPELVVPPVSQPEPEPEQNVEVPAIEQPPVENLAEEVITEQEPEDGTVSLGMILGLFVAANLIIATLVGAFLFIKNRRRAKQSPDQDDIEEEVESETNAADEPDSAMEISADEGDAGNSAGER